MDLMVFEQDKVFVVDAFKDGEFDYIEAVSESSETKFFNFAFKEGIIEKLAKTYPTPREKEEVPLWMYVASDISLRLHGAHSFHRFPWVVRCGGLLNALGPQIAKKKIEEETGNLIISCNGFNNKNLYPRKTPCDQDYLRKLAKDTDAEKLHQWYNRDVVRLLLEMDMIDEEGIFIGDASYIFVPDNENYQGSVVLLFDENNHPVGNKDELTKEQLKRCRYRRCYKLVSLIHTNRAKEFFLYTGLRILPGNAHECPVLYELVDGFIEAAGKGVMKRLIVDRGFIDGEEIGRCKEERGVEIIIPVKKRMDIYEDVMGLLSLEDEIHWQEYRPVESLEEPTKHLRPEVINRREKTRQKTLSLKKRQKESGKKREGLLKKLVAGIKGFTSWSSCSIPLNVVVNKDIYEDGREEQWMLITTSDFDEPKDITMDYEIRTAIEERHRQLKCFWDLADFRSCAFSLVTNQIIFVALAYTLLQIHLIRLGKSELNLVTRSTVSDRLLPGGEHAILYYQNRFCFLSVLEHQELVLTLREYARKKILRKTRRLKREILVSSKIRPP